MGRRGPAPTPTPILKLRGSTLVTKRREQREVKGPPGMPRCPDWLDDDAKVMWKTLLPQLQLMGVVTRIDGNALSRYCHLWVRWRKAEEFVRQHGDVYTIKDDAGKVKYIQQFPQVAIAGRIAQQLTRLEAEFGMSPSARARLQLSPQSQQDVYDAKSRFFDDAG